MSFDSYRRAMDENKLSEEMKSVLAGYSEATPLHGNPKFEKIKRRRVAKIASLASLAACFTIVCFVGVPLLAVTTLFRCGASAPEEAEPTESRPPWYVYADEDDSVNVATAATGVTGATVSTEDFSLEGSYSHIYMLVCDDSLTESTTSGTKPSRTEAETEESLSTSTLPVLQTQCTNFSAVTDDSGASVVILNEFGEEKTITYGDGTKILALCSYENCLVVCTESNEQTNALVYVLTESGIPRQLGELGVSGDLMTASCEGNILTVVTEFTPSPGAMEDLATYIPRIELDGKKTFVSPEDCIVVDSASGEYTCYVELEIELGEEPIVLSVRAEFIQKSSAGANKK